MDTTVQSFELLTNTTLDRPNTFAPAVSRDNALDVLRGWAIILKVVNHIGPSTRIAAIAHFTWYVTAANWFVALSGVVFGMVCARRLCREGRAQTYRRVLSRAGSLWLIHCVLMYSVIVFHETTGKLHYVTSVREVGGWLKVLWMVPALRFTSNEFMNILPMYVIFLGLTPLALECLQRRKTGWLLLVSLCMYGLAQRYPGWGLIADPISGKSIFNVEAWQFIYVCGLCAGYHRETIARELWPRHRGWLLPLSIVVFFAIFGFAQLQRPSLARLGCVYPAAAPYFWGKLTAAPGQTIYFFAILIVSYWFVRRAQRAESSLVQAIIQPLSTIGRSSLYCFLVHLVFALAAHAMNAQDWPAGRLEILTVAAVCAIYIMARYRVLVKLIPN